MAQPAAVKGGVFRPGASGFASRVESPNIFSQIGL